jgi:hypothetical protein
MAASISKELLQNLKTRGGFYSGLDAFMQANKQDKKSHATVPLSASALDLQSKGPEAIQKGASASTRAL